MRAWRVAGGQCLADIIQRCYNSAHKFYPYYGGRGIKVCKRWRGRDGFKNFSHDMGAPPRRHTIDRYPDNNGDYTPENCRWATRSQQARNTRFNRVISYKGKSKCLAEWAEGIGITSKGLQRRLENWPLSRALQESSHVY